MTSNTVAEWVDEMSSDLKQQLKDRVSKFEYLSIAIDETVDITGIKHLAVFTRACDHHFHVYKELVELAPIHDTTSAGHLLDIEAGFP